MSELSLSARKLQEQPLLAGPCTGSPTGPLPRSPHKLGDAGPAWDGAGMPSVPSCLHPWPHGSGTCAPTPLSGWGWLLLGAFGGPVVGMAEG